MGVHGEQPLDPLAKLVSYAIMDNGHPAGDGWADVDVAYIKRATSLTPEVWDVCVARLVRAGVIVGQRVEGETRWYKHSLRA